MHFNLFESKKNVDPNSNKNSVLEGSAPLDRRRGLHPQAPEPFLIEFPLANWLLGSLKLKYY